MKKALSILMILMLFVLPAMAKTKSKKTSKKQTIKKVVKKAEPEITEFQVVEDASKFEEIVEEARYCDIMHGIHIRFLVRAPHKYLFFVCGSLEAQKKTKTQYIPNIEDPYTINWIAPSKKKLHFNEMGGFGGEKSEIEVSPEKILVHVSIPWNDKMAPLYTREIMCDEKTCSHTKFTCDIKPEKEDKKLIPDFTRFLESIADSNNRKGETWDDVWKIYMGKILFQALSAQSSAIEFMNTYPQKETYPSDGVFAETLMTIKDDFELAKKAGCVK